MSGSASLSPDEITRRNLLLGAGATAIAAAVPVAAAAENVLAGTVEITIDAGMVKSAATRWYPIEALDELFEGYELRLVENGSGHQAYVFVEADAP